MVQVIIYLPGQSAYTPRVDEFRRCGEELGRRLVWKGRPLTAEEFNKEFPGIIENARLKWDYEPIVEIIEEAPAAVVDLVEEAPAAAVEQEQDGGAAVIPEKKRRGRPPSVKKPKANKPVTPVVTKVAIPEEEAKPTVQPPKQRGPRFHMLQV